MMKKLTLVIVCAALTLVLAGCGNTTVEKEQGEKTSTRITASTSGIHCTILTDTETGVQYLLADKSVYGGPAITPLLNADGTPCVEENDE